MPDETQQNRLSKGSEEGPKNIDKRIIAKWQGPDGNQTFEDEIEACAVEIRNLVGLLNS